MKIERKTTAASIAPLQSLAQGSMFWQPDHIEASPWLDHLPWIFWLMETMQPQRCVTLGARPGSPHLAFCQATMRIDPNAECLLVSNESEASDITAAAERRYGGCHRLVNASPASAAKRMPAGIDILALDLAADDENMDIILERWLGLMSEKGVVLLPGINGGDALHVNHELFASLQERYPALSFHHGEGLGVVMVGSAPVELVETLLERWKTPSAARAVRDIFARLGRGVADQALNDQHKAKLDDVQKRFEEVAQERNASSERADELRQTLGVREYELAKLTEENRHLDEKLADAHSELTSSNEERSRLNKTLAERQDALQEARTQLEESSAQRAALEGQVAEKDANISTRFNELALLTNELEDKNAKLEASEAQLQNTRIELEESIAQKAALEHQVAEKDANITTRFEELAVLTNMIEEADQKSERWKHKASQYYERNEAKKVEAKEFRRQIAAADDKNNAQSEQIERLQANVNSLSAREAELESSVDASEAAYGDAMLRVDELERDLKSSADASEAAYGDAMHRVDELERALKSATRSESEALERERATGKRLAELDHILQKTKRSLGSRYKELGSLTAAMEAKEAELEEFKLKHGEADSQTHAKQRPSKPSGKLLNRFGKNAEQRKLQKAIDEVEASQWFDGQWYLQQYPDIASDDKFQSRPAFHYVKFGGFEGRDPSPHFDSAAYLQAYPDVVATGINPLVHFIRDGIREEREPRPDAISAFNEDE